MLNGIGDETVPCCRSSKMSKVNVEVLVPSQVINFLLAIMFQMLNIRAAGQLNLLSMNMRPFSHTESKAFSISIR